jgi:hypothetical protein
MMSVWSRAELRARGPRADIRHDRRTDRDRVFACGTNVAVTWQRRDGSTGGSSHSYAKSPVM